MPPGRPPISWGDGLRSPESAAASSAADLGGKDAAQVYNRVLSDAIEGGIFLPLTDKLDETGRTPGEADEQANVTDDPRAPRFWVNATTDLATISFIAKRFPTRS